MALMISRQLTRTVNRIVLYHRSLTKCEAKPNLIVSRISRVEELRIPVRTTITTPDQDRERTRAFYSVIVVVVLSISLAYIFGQYRKVRLVQMSQALLYENAVREKEEVKERRKAAILERKKKLEALEGQKSE